MIKPTRDLSNRSYHPPQIENYSTIIKKYIDDPNVTRDWVINALLEEVKLLEIELQELKGKQRNERLSRSGRY